MVPRLIARVLAAGVAAGVLLLGAGAALADAGDPSSVVMQGNQFAPTEQVVAVGTMVTWTNTDPEQHDVLSDDNTLSSPIIDPGSSWSFTFTAPGMYHYVCDLHANMEATITVTG